MELTDVIKGGTAAAAVYGISKTPKLDDIKVTKGSDKTDKEMENLLGSKDRAKEFIAPFESTLTAEELGKLGLKKDVAGQIVAMDAVTAGKMRDINAEIDASYEQYRDSVNAISNSDADDVSNIQGSEKHTSIGGNSYTTSNGNLVATPNNSISTKYFQDLADKALADKGSLYRNTIGKITGTAGWQQMTKSDVGKALAMPMIGAMISGTFPIAAVAGMWSANKEKLEQATNLVNDISGGTFDSNKPYGFRSGQQVFNYMLGWQNLDGELKKRGTNLKDFVRWGHSQGFITNQVLSNVNKYNPEYFEKVNTINARAKMAKPEADIAIATGIGDSGFVGTGGEPVGFGQVLHGEAEVVTKPKVEKPSIGVSLHGGEPTVTKPEPIVTKSEPTITKPEPTVTSGGQPVSGPHEPSGSGAVSVSVQEQGKDQSGVADDVKRDLNEGDFVINAPAREMAGHSDIERMITKAITELQRKGVKLDFGQKAEDPDSIVQALVSNKEVIIPKVIAQQIGYDRLEKINNRGKERVDEIEKEKVEQEKGFVQGQPQTQRAEPQQVVQMGGQITLEENKNQPIAVPKESFATMSSVGKRLLSPLSPEQADKELTELSKPSQSFEGFVKPIKMKEGDKIVPKPKPDIDYQKLLYRNLKSQNIIMAGDKPYQLRDEAIAGIMGNVSIETGGTFDYRTQQQGGGPGQGLFQFEGGHLQAYEQYKKDKNLTPSTSAQVNYVLDNIYNGVGFDIGAKNRQNLIKVFETGSEKEVADAFVKLFEKPNPNKNPKYNERMEEASKIFAQLPSDKSLEVTVPLPYTTEKYGGMLAVN